MPTKLKIDRAAGVVYSTLYGELRPPDLVHHIAQIREHPDFNPFFSELVDATQVTSLDLPSGDIQRFAVQDSPFEPSAQRVLVASEDLVFGLARMFQTFGSHRRPNFAVVRTLAEAHELLGLNDASAAG